MQHRRIISQDRQCQYKRNTEARSCNHCCGGKTITITYCKCVCVALIIQQAYCHLWLVPLYNIFSHYLRNGQIFERCYGIQNACFDFL